MTEPDALKARVLASVAVEVSPTRRAARRRVLVALCVSVVFALNVFTFAGGIDHSSGRPRHLTLELASGWVAFCVALTTAIVWRRGSTLGPSPRVVLGLAALTPIVLLGWMQLFDGRYTEPFERVGFRCLALTLVNALVPMGALFMARAGSEPRRPAWLGAALGVVSGAWSGVLVHLWCPLTNLPHAAVGHALPLLVLMVVGAYFGTKRLGFLPS